MLEYQLLSNIKSTEYVKSGKYYSICITFVDNTVYNPQRLNWFDAIFYKKGIEVTLKEQEYTIKTNKK